MKWCYFGVGSTISASMPTNKENQQVLHFIAKSVTSNCLFWHGWELALVIFRFPLFTEIVQYRCYVAYHCRCKNAVYWECSARNTSCGCCPATVVECNGAFHRCPSQHCQANTVGLRALSHSLPTCGRTADMFMSASAIVASAMTVVDVVSGPHDRQPTMNSMVHLCMLLNIKYGIKHQQSHCTAQHLTPSQPSCCMDWQTYDNGIAYTALA